MLDICRLQCRYRSAWLLVGLGTVGCGAADITDPPDDGPPLDFTGTWNPSTNMGGPWGHDGNPVVSDNFLVFSGYASQAARQYASDVAEESLGEIMEFYVITPDAFEFMPTYEEPRIHILAIKDQDFRRNSGFAYRDGLVIISRESPNYQAWGFEPVRYKRLIQHETMHVVEFLLIGNPLYRQASDVWWREGMAHYIQYLDTFKSEHNIRYGEHWAPHDIEVRELMSGKSRRDTAKEMGIIFRVVKQHSIADGIEATRRLFNRFWFDEKRCEQGFNCIASYHREYDDKREVYRDYPVHDWASHGADGLRQLAMAWNERLTKELKPMVGTIATSDFSIF